MHIVTLVWAFCLWLPQVAIGQDCVSQGDPLVRVDFGVGTPGFGVGTTTYQLNQSGPLSDGEYKIASNIQQGRPEWHNLGDASSDPDGLMLVVNASHAPGEFYRVRVDGLCANTRFVFTADIANANQPSNCGDLVLPRVRFVMEDLAGNVVGEYSTGHIGATSQPQWIPFSFPFNTGTEQSFYLVLINDNPGGCGNDLAIDNIRFAPCGPEVELSSAAGLIAADTLYYCAHQTGQITLEGSLPAGGEEGFVYQWQTRQGNDAWQDMDGETNRTIAVDRVPGMSYRLAVAAEQASMDIQGCRFTSPEVTLKPATDATDFDRGVAYQWEVCENSEVTLRQGVVVPAQYGLVSGARWDQYVNGAWQEVSRDETYAAPTDVLGDFRYRHVVELACGGDIVTDDFGLAIRETVVASLVLATRTACVADAPIPLSGGALSVSWPGFVGEYAGPGVVDGMFYPDVAGPGTHAISFSLAGGYPCSEIAWDTIEVFEMPAIQPMADIRLRLGGHLTLQPDTDGTDFSWSGGAGLNAYDVRNPVASPTTTTTYRLDVRNAQGCLSTATVTVIVLPDLDIPNAFTPNDDGFNDQWQIPGLDLYTGVNVQVFNRWGNVVFTSDGSTPWDGRHKNTELPAGTYYYIITADQLYERVSGAVSILR